MTYQDMPSLMSVRRSPDSKPTPSPSTYFRYPTPTEYEPDKNVQMGDPGKQKLLEMRLYDQQCAILNDILGSNQFNSPATQPPPLMPAQKNPPAPLNTFQVQVIPSCPQSMQIIQPSPVLSQSHVQTAINTSPAIKEKKSSTEMPPKTPSPISPIEIRIPSPKRVNYVPNTTDVIISTPQVSDFMLM